MTPTAGAAGPVVELPRLVQIIVHTDGAVMRCHYCQACASVDAADVAGQILRFQDKHFDCDPAVAAADRSVAAVPGQYRPEGSSPSLPTPAAPGGAGIPPAG